MKHLINFTLCLLIASGAVLVEADPRRTVDVKFIRNINYNPPKKWIPREEDKGGYWYQKDYGDVEAIDVYSGTYLIAAAIKDRKGRAVRLFIINYRTGKMIKKPVMQGSIHRNIEDVKISPNGKYIAVAEGRDKTFSIWDAKSGKRLGRVKTEAKAGHIDWHPNGTRVAVATKEHIEIWKVTKPAKREKRIPGARDRKSGWTSSLAWSPDGRYLAIGTNEPAVYIANLQKGAQSAALKPKPNSGVDQLEWSPDGTKLSSRGLGYKSTINVWLNPHKAVDNPLKKDYRHLVTFDPKKYTGTWKTMSWNSNSKHLAIGDNQRHFYFFNAANGKLVHKFTPYGNKPARHAKWKGSALITYGISPSSDKQFKIWRTTLGR